MRLHAVPLQPRSASPPFAAPSAHVPVTPKHVDDTGPKFGGVTGSLEGRHWVSPENFQKLLNISSTPYIGQLPSALMKVSPESPKQIYQALDELAPILRHVRELDYPSFECQLGPSNTPVTLQSVGHGGFGTVYLLTINNQSFALKVYHQQDDESALQGFAECATGLYFSKIDLKNLARFYCANPKTGWGGFEFITEDILEH